jgi:hypothetical protein
MKRSSQRQRKKSQLKKKYAISFHKNAKLYLEEGRK